MGYKYGVWYTYPNATLNTSHQGHFTVTCFMEKEDAIKLYHDIDNKYGTLIDIHIDLNKPIIYEPNMYEDDDNNLQSWGYNGHNEGKNNWKNLEEISTNYKCNFSHQPHTSIFYSKSEEEIKKQIHKQKEDKQKENNHNQYTIIKCELNVVDICSDDPMEWSIIYPL